MGKSAKIRWLRRVIAKEQNPEIQGMLWYQLLDSTKENKEK